jgi:hypothetical protein
MLLGAMGAWNFAPSQQNSRARFYTAFLYYMLFLGHPTTYQNKSKNAF